MQLSGNLSIYILFVVSGHNQMFMDLLANRIVSEYFGLH